MRTHLEALKAAATAAGGAPVYLGSVTALPAVPYALLEVVSGRGEEGALDGAPAGIDVTVRVKAVALTPEAAAHLADEIRAGLCPSWRPSRLEVSGWSTDLVWLRHEADYVDRGVVVPSTNTHPHLAVDSYAIRSTPL